MTNAVRRAAAVKKNSRDFQKIENYKVKKLSSSMQLQFQLNWGSLIITIGPNPPNPTQLNLE